MSNQLNLFGLRASSAPRPAQEPQRLGAFTIASWNVNSIRSRLDHVLRWLDMTGVDIACLQELKCDEGSFPYEAFSSMGYTCAVHGQPRYNGVAILSKRGAAGHASPLAQ